MFQITNLPKMSSSSFALNLAIMVAMQTTSGSKKAVPIWYPPEKGGNSRGQTSGNTKQGRIQLPTRTGKTRRKRQEAKQTLEAMPSAKGYRPVTVFNRKRGFVIPREGQKSLRISFGDCRVKLDAVLNERCVDLQNRYVSLSKADYSALNWALRDLLFSRLYGDGLLEAATAVTEKAQRGLVRNGLVLFAVDLIIAYLQDPAPQRSASRYLAKKKPSAKLKARENRKMAKIEGPDGWWNQLSGIGRHVEELEVLEAMGVDLPDHLFDFRPHQGAAELLFAREMVPHRLTDALGELHVSFPRDMPFADAESPFMVYREEWVLQT